MLNKVKKELPKLQLLIEEVENGGGIVCDNNSNDIVFSSTKDAKDYIYKMHPIWTDGLTKKESKQTFAIYDKKNPSRDLLIIKF